MKKLLFFGVIFFIGCSSLQLRDKEYAQDAEELKIEAFQIRFQEKVALKNHIIDSLINVNDSRIQIDKNGKAIRPNAIIANGKPVYYRTHKFSAKEAINAQELQNGGSLNLSLYGEGVRIGVWDEDNIFVNHQEFLDNNNNTIIETQPFQNEDITNSHGTSVSGMIIARGVAQFQSYDIEGIAPNLEKLMYYDMFDDDIEVENAVASHNNFVASNHSYGIYIYDSENDTYQLEASEIGVYFQNDAILDDIANAYQNYLYVVSAGNEGTVTYPGQLIEGYDLMTPGTLAKNILTVGSIKYNNEDALNPYEVTDFSQAGPADDGRIKPEICTVGEGVPLAYYDINDPINTAMYAIGNGTSYASPTATGGVALLQQLYKEIHGDYMLSSTVRGLMCHTALDVETWGTKQVLGPDPKTGFGILDLEQAASVIIDSETDQYAIIEFDMAQGEEFGVTFTATATNQPLIASICWIDPTGTSSVESNLINDIDLRVNQNQTYFPWKLDANDITASATKGDNTADNIEKIEIENPSGAYQVTVSHKGTLSAPQKVSLIISGTGGVTLSKDALDAIQNQQYIVYQNKNTLSVRSSDMQPFDAIKLVDVLGKVHYYSSDIKSNRHNIDIAGFAKGIYFTQIFLGRDRNTIKTYIK